MTTGPRLTPHEKLEQAAWKLSGGEWSPEYQVITDMALQLKNADSRYNLTIGRCPVYLNGSILADAARVGFHPYYLTIDTENE